MDVNVHVDWLGYRLGVIFSVYPTVAILLSDGGRYPFKRLDDFLVGSQAQRVDTEMGRHTKLEFDLRKRWER
nr:hypothetical protein HmN_000924700 [Hymenolepis microstoma]